MDLGLYFAIWGALALVVLTLAVYRIMLDHREDNVVHLTGTEAGLVPMQAQLAGKIKTVSRWGETLTIVLAVYGLILVAIWGYHAWLQAYQPPQ